MGFLLRKEASCRVPALSFVLLCFSSTTNQWHLNWARLLQRFHQAHDGPSPPGRKR